MIKLIVLAGLATVASATGAQTQTAVGDLGTCLSDNTTGRDRKDLARWMFAAMAAHPDMAALSAVTDADREESARVAGVLFTRLMTEACPNEMRAAVAEGGAAAIGDGFETLGGVAIRELMRNERVAAAIGDIQRFMDEDRIGEVVGDP